jgi:hypothetical protein
VVRVTAYLLLLASTTLVPTPAAMGQSPSQGDRAPPNLDCAARVPFGVGERMEFTVRLGALGVGRAQVEVTGLETVRGHLTYLVDWTIRGGIPLARLNDHYRSWIDVRSLASRRYIQDIHQGRRKRLRHFEIHPEELRYDWVGVERGLPLLSDHPLDDISFVYYMRSIPLEVGDTFTFNRYFREHGNPVKVEVLRREEIQVPAGTFPAIVVRPVVQDSGLWGEDAEAEVHFSDDSERRLLQIRLRAPIRGFLTLQLTGSSPGDVLNAAC